MPMGGFKDFAECIAFQKKKGYSEQAAGGICGLIEKRHKAKQEKMNEADDFLDFLDEFDNAQLDYSTRKDLPDSAFAIPEKRAYPINDAVHARNALARVSQFGSPEEKARVRAAVKRRYPNIDVGE